MSEKEISKIDEKCTLWRDPKTAPRDGTEILIKTKFGVVSAWFCHELDECYDWICYDDEFIIPGEEPILGWMPVPE